MRSRPIPRLVLLAGLGACLILASPASAQEPAPVPPEREVPAPTRIELAPPVLPPEPAIRPVAPVPEPGAALQPTVPLPSIPSVDPHALPMSIPGAPRVGRLAIHPFIRLIEEYSDNFRREAANREANLRSTLSPGLSIHLDRIVTRGALGYALSASHDTSTDDVNLFHSISGELSWQATPRLTLTVSDALTRGDDPTQADRLRLRQERTEFTSNTLALTADYRPGTTIDVRPYYRWSTFTSTEDDTTTHVIGSTVSVTLYQTHVASVGYELLHSSTGASGAILGHQVSASFTRQVNTRTTIGVAGAYAVRDGNDDSVDDSYTLGNVSVFSVHTIPGRWSLNSNLGVSQVSGTSGGPETLISSLTSFVYHLARGTFGLSVEQGFSETFRQGQNAGVVGTRGATASFTHAVTPGIALALGAFYRENDSSKVSTGSARGNTGSETTWGGTASIAVRLTPTIAMSGDYSYENGTSNVRGVGGGRDFTENRARITLQLAF